MLNLMADLFSWTSGGLLALFSEDFVFQGKQKYCTIYLLFACHYYWNMVSIVTDTHTHTVFEINKSHGACDDRSMII